ncbi:MAG: hypothetical protein P8Y80_06540 [Acidobacteriota bacterium]
MTLPLGDRGSLLVPDHSIDSLGIEVGKHSCWHLFAARLPDLNGKVIAELAVDPTKWQPHRTMPYIEELLKKQFPDIKFIPMQEFPMGIQVSSDQVIRMVAARKPDAVIIGNAG